MIPTPLLVSDVKGRADFVAIASRYASLRRSGRQWRGLCPFHSERHPSFYVHPERKIFYCFGCLVGGDLFDFIMRAEGCDFSEALRIVAGGVGFSAKAPKGPKHGRAVFARPFYIDGKTERSERSFSPANSWPSLECAAERAFFTCQTTDNC